VRSSSAKTIFNHIENKLERAVDQLFSQLNTDARNITPIRTGRAKRGWRKTSTYRIGDSKVLVENKVPYIGLLDQGRSRQAPAGIIVPVLSKILKQRRTIR